MEQWKIIDGFNGNYEVSDLGVLRRVDNGKIMNGHLNEGGYRRICLCANGVSKNVFLHHVVIKTFLGERPEKHDVNHKNGDKTDNRLMNLEYVNRVQHEYHTRHILKRQRSPVGAKHGNAILTEQKVRAIHEEYCNGNITQKELGEKHGVALTTISGILMRRIWKHLNLPVVPKRDYHLKGLENPLGKVSPELKQEIKKLYKEGKGATELARHFNLGKTTIYRIVNS